MSQREHAKWVETSVEEIERVRENAGLTKVAMAQYLGRTNASYHTWLSAGVVPPPLAQTHIRRTLDILAAWPRGVPLPPPGGGGLAYHGVVPRAPAPTGLPGVAPGNPPSLETQPTSCRREGYETPITYEGPKPSHNKHLQQLSSATGSRPSFQGSILLAVADIASAAFGAGMDFCPEQVPTFVRDLRRAIE